MDANLVVMVVLALAALVVCVGATNVYNFMEILEEIKKMELNKEINKKCLQKAESNAFEVRCANINKYREDESKFHT